jgi:tetratricopeptide (TPR) repeat protein
MRSCLACVALILSASAVHAQSYKAGDKVMVKSWDVTLGESGKEVKTRVQLGDIFTVTKVNGDWLWVGQGWIAKRDVVRYDQAIAYFTAKIRSDPSDRRNYHNRAWAYEVMGEHDKAIADEGETIRLDADDAENLGVDYNSRGCMWRNKGELDIAIADFNEAIRNKPNYPDAHFNRGRSWRMKGEYDKAISDLNEAIRLDTKDTGNYAERGTSWEARGNYDKALADYNQAIKVDSKDSAGFASLAWLLATCPDEKFRDGAKAVGSATKACELDNWTDADDADTLAAAYAEKGDFDSAVKWETNALDLKLNPWSDNKPTDLHARLELYKSGKPYREELKK